MIRIVLIFLSHLIVALSVLLFARTSPQSPVSATLISTPNLIPITLTAYSPCPTQTEGHPRQMASGKYATDATLQEMWYAAVSRDLKKYLEWGDSIFLEFIVEDLMAPSFDGKPITNTIDLFVPTEEMANDIGRQTWRRIIIVKQPAP